MKKINKMFLNSCQNFSISIEKTFLLYGAQNIHDLLSFILNLEKFCLKTK